MGHDRYLALKFSAVTLAQNAVYGFLDPTELASLISRCDEEIGTADPLFRAVSAFSSECDMVQQGHGDLEEAGRRLRHAIEVLNMPEPPGAERSDING